MSDSDSSNSTGSSSSFSDSTQEYDEIKVQTVDDLLSELKNTDRDVDIEFNPSGTNLVCFTLNKRIMKKLTRRCKGKNIRFLRVRFKQQLSIKFFEAFRKTQVETCDIDFEKYKRVLSDKDYINLMKYLSHTSNLNLTLDTRKFNSSFIKALAEEATEEDSILKKLSIDVRTNSTMIFSGLASFRVLNDLSLVHLDIELYEDCPSIGALLSKTVSCFLNVIDMKPSRAIWLLLNKNCQELEIHYSTEENVRLSELAPLIILGRSIHRCRQITLENLVDEISTRTELKSLFNFYQEDLIDDLASFSAISNTFKKDEIAYIEEYIDYNFTDE